MSVLRKKKSGRKQKITTGIVFLVFASPCTISMLHDLLTGTGDVGATLMLLVFFGTFTAVGGYQLWRGFQLPREPQVEITEDVERAVLKLAYSREGTLTVSELGLKSRLSLDESKLVLDYLEQKDVARSSVRSDGTIEYEFPELLEEEPVDPLAAEIERAATMPEPVEKKHQ